MNRSTPSDPADLAIVEEVKKTNPNVPDYVFDYAPLIYLHKDEKYFPSDISSQVTHTTPFVSFKPLTEPDIPKPLTLANLDQLNPHGGTKIYLTSKDDITKNPSWLYGVKPDPKTHKTEGGITTTAVVVRDHADTPGDKSGFVDVFYFYFYAYNQGNLVLDREYGDHVGDWENVMVRFKTGKPTALWLSQHALGEGFTYKAIEKHGLRPIAYSAQGSHANYAVTGAHDHAIPNFNLPAGFVLDYASAGFLWDPVQTSFFYSYNGSTKKFTSFNGSDPTSWLNFEGQWGDDQYPASDKRQVETFGKANLAKYVGGPNGPVFKKIVRKEVWPDGSKSFVREVLMV